MKTNATAIANFFVDLAQMNGKELRLIGLIKRVYITQGFTLAIHNRTALDSRFDVVEAWKLGPVIPSIYHSFKHFKTEPITEPSVILVDGLEFLAPILEDENVKDIASSVWRRYINYSDSDMINLLHQKETPWGYCYVEGENRVIPDDFTKLYYTKLLEYENKRN